MSFRFNWTFFDEARLLDQAKAVIRRAMNKTVKPDVIVGEMAIDRLEFGSVPPKLEMLEVGDLDTDKFRGIFKLDYAGDASMSLLTKVEANRLALVRSKGPVMGVPTMLAAAASLQLPLRISISHIAISAVIVVVVSQAKGLTVVFQNDPVQSVKVESSLDFIPGVSDFIHQEIFARLQESIREDMPELLYELSQEKIGQRAQQDLQQMMDHLQHAPHGVRRPSTDWSSLPLSPEHWSMPLIRPYPACLDGLSQLHRSRQTLSGTGPGIEQCVTRATLAACEQAEAAEYARSHGVPDTAFSSPLAELEKVIHCPTKPSAAMYRHVRPKRRVIKLSKSSPEHSPSPPSPTLRTLTPTPPASPPISSIPSTPSRSKTSSSVATAATSPESTTRDLKPRLAHLTPTKLDFKRILEKQDEIMQWRQSQQDKCNLKGPWSDEPFPVVGAPPGPPGYLWTHHGPPHLV